MDRRQVAFELLNEELAKEGLNLALIALVGLYQNTTDFGLRKMQMLFMKKIKE